MEFYELPFGSPAYRKLLILREEILRKPLGLSFSEEDLVSEKDQFHLGLFSGEHLIGGLLLKPVESSVIQMRQVVVGKKYQGKSYGRLIVNKAELFARDKGFGEMMLHARREVIPFYRKLGYRTRGEEFIEVTIPHMEMWKKMS